MSNIFEQGLDKNAANFTALSPVSFVERSAEVFGDLPSVLHGQRKYTWAQTRERSARLAAALKSLGITRGSTVSAMLPNTPEMVDLTGYYKTSKLGMLPQKPGESQVSGAHPYLENSTACYMSMPIPRSGVDQQWSKPDGFLW